MTHPCTISIPCPFGDECPNTLTATVYPSRPATHGDPAERTTVEDIRGCEEHVHDYVDNREPSQWLESTFLDQLAEDDQDAKVQHDDQKIDERLGK